MRNKSSTLTVKKEKKGSVECSSISCLLKKKLSPTGNSIPLWLSVLSFVNWKAARSEPAKSISRWNASVWPSWNTMVHNGRWRAISTIYTVTRVMGEVKGQDRQVEVLMHITKTKKSVWERWGENQTMYYRWAGEIILLAMGFLARQVK